MNATAATWNADKTEVTIDYSTKPIAPGSHKFYIDYASSTGQKAKDNYGNELAPVALDITVAKDDVAPTVTNVTAVDANNIEVTYSEEVIGALTPSNYTLKDAAGNTVAITNVKLKDNTKATYVLTTADLKGGNYTLTIDGITDKSVSKNKLAKYKTTLSVADKLAPTIGSAAAAQDANRSNKYNIIGVGCLSPVEDCQRLIETESR